MLPESDHELRGFRRKWSRAFSADVSPVEGDVLPDFDSEPEIALQEHLNDDGDQVHLIEQLLQNRDLESDPGHGSQHDSSFEIADGPLVARPEPIQPQVIDPCNVEPDWKRIALQSSTAVERVIRPTLPWEDPSVASVFRTGGLFQGTIVAGMKHVWAPTSIGLTDVLESTVVNRREPSTSSVPAGPPVIPINLKSARREQPDEDIRRAALFKLRDLILQDPKATSLGCSLWELTDGSSDDIIVQSFHDCFRTKASSTLQKRSQSLWRLATLLRGVGVFAPLRVNEPQLYEVLCNMRSQGAGPTSAQHIIEALFFLDSTAKLTLINIRDVVSGRCRGVARDMYLLKNPLAQKEPLTARQVEALERCMKPASDVHRCILGQLLFCIHSCCRWKDGQRVKSVRLETSRGETLVHADALSSKTALTAEAKTRFLPFVAIGTGLLREDWSSMWMSSRDSQGLWFGDFALPSFSFRSQSWTSEPMSASEATFWLREFLSLETVEVDLKCYGSHSCKSTILTWAGRYTVSPFSDSERRLLGHHLGPNMKSVLTYSREAYTSLYSKVFQMFVRIRDRSFDPDMPAVERVVSAPVHQDEMPVTIPSQVDGAVLMSDSESSVASDVANPTDLDLVPSTNSNKHAFDEFPGVPASALMVHNISGIVHVVNEDDSFLCGRHSSKNYTMFVELASCSHHFEACSQCLKTNRNAGLDA